MVKLPAKYIYVRLVTALVLGALLCALPIQALAQVPQVQSQYPNQHACMSGGGDARQSCSTSGLQLSASQVDRSGLVDQYGARQLHLTQALHATGYYMQRGICGQSRVSLPLTYSYCWPGTYQTGKWMPQGVTGDGESGWEAVADRSLTFVSWYYNNKTSHKHSITRLSMIDNDTSRFVTVRLVTPRAGKHPGCTYSNGVSLCYLVSHAGGLAWSGQYLYVAGTNRIHVFDLTRFLHVGNKYVLPEVGRYNEASGGAFRISFLSVDTSRHELITGTFDRTASTERIIHWPLAADGNAIETTASYAAALYGRSLSSYLQGAASHDGHYYLAQSSNGWSGNKLHSVSLGGEARTYHWVHGSEDLYLDPKRSILWGAGEFAGNRSVIGVNASNAF